MSPPGAFTFSADAEAESATSASVRIERFIFHYKSPKKFSNHETFQIFLPALVLKNPLFSSQDRCNQRTDLLTARLTGKHKAKESFQGPLLGRAHLKESRHSLAI
jgi:hypothetical protein